MLYESEKRILTALWRAGSLKASELIAQMKEEYGWNRNTTYTVIKKCVDKKLVKRTDPGYICSPLVSRKQIQVRETRELLDGVFDGNLLRMMTIAAGLKPLSRYEVKELRRIIR